MTYEHPSIVECHETFVRDESWLKEKNQASEWREVVERDTIWDWPLDCSEPPQSIHSHLLGLLNFGETSLCVFIVAYFQFSLFDLIFFVFCLNILGVVCICV
jgi:hypothetical protein